MGRPTGSKNKPHHSAGGQRPNCGRKQVEIKQAAGQKQLSFGQHAHRRNQPEHGQAVPADTEPDPPDQIKQPQPLSGDQEGNRAGETAAAAAAAAEAAASAEQMEVKCPPLPPSGWKEMKILNEYYIKHPNATNKDFEALAMEFLHRADGVDIFPKLPAMLKADFGRWNKTSRIKMTVRALDDHGYTALLKNFSSRRTSDGSLLHFNEMQIEDSSDDFILPLDEDPLEAQQYVPPVAAPFQREQIPMEAQPSASTERTLRRCAWFPCCNKRVWECGGFRKKSCQRAIRGEFEIPNDEVFKRRRKEALSANRAERRQAQRDAQSPS